MKTQGPPEAVGLRQRAGGKRDEEISWEELAQHSSPDDLWIAISGVAYDVTEWKHSHPGGWRLLEFYGGKDATEPWIAYHAGPSRKPALGLMVGLRVGKMVPRPESVQAAAFRKMAEEVEKADLYKRNHWSYYLLYAYLAGLYLLTWWLIFQGTWWGILVGSCTIGAFWGQLAFIGHDVGHTCVHDSRWMDCWVGFMVNSFLGIGVSHWVDNHNAHHCVPNSSDCDPEVQFMPFIAPSTLHFEHTRKGMNRLESALSCISKTLVSYQHWSFIPLLLFARYKFYFQSLGHLAIGRKVYINWYSELFAEIFFLSWVTVMTLQLPTLQMRAAWVILSHASDFILYLQTVITHFPREISPGVKTEWIESQAIGTLNWFSPPELDWYHGGLQWQIEHHLFPRIPRHNLRESSKIIRPVLKELGIEYHSPTFFGAIVETFESLKVVALEARLPMGPWKPDSSSVAEPIAKIIPKAVSSAVVSPRA